MVNHFEAHKCITTKDGLFKSLQNYFHASTNQKSQSTNPLEGYVFDWVPLTFLIESNSSTFKGDIENFKNVFKIFKENSQKDLDEDKHEERIERLNDKFSSNTWYINRHSKQTIKIQCPDTHFEGHNLWFLKWTQFNRGRGIYVFNTFEQLISLINEMEKGLIKSDANEITGLKSDKKKPSTFGQNTSENTEPKIKSSTFVIHFCDSKVHWKAFTN